MISDKPFLTNKQQEFLDAVAAGSNIFLTGKAGTGKSFIIRKAIESLKGLGKKVIAVAPTGIAANNIGGQTIHSLFQLSPFGVLTFETCNFLSKSARQVMYNADVVIIDEVSMLRPDILDAMHWTLRKNGLKGLYTKQLIFVGDLKQLPVILDDNTRSVLMQSYQGDTFLDALIMEQLNLLTIELDEILRQTNEPFINALNEIREGRKTDYFRQFLSDQPRGIILAPHNSTVQYYNEAGLQAQPGEVYTFTASISGTAKPEDFNLESEIRVKDGCRIMYLANSHDNPLHNGTLGTFVAKDGKYFIKVDGSEVTYALEPIMVVKKQYVFNAKKDILELQELGKIVQYPFKLAYALSIHKSQGLTFDEVTVDLRRPCFQKGQMYVALSRVKSPEGLRLIVN